MICKKNVVFLLLKSHLNMGYIVSLSVPIVTKFIIIKNRIMHIYISVLKTPLSIEFALSVCVCVCGDLFFIQFNLGIKPVYK